MRRCIAVMRPTDSWVSKWQRIDKFCKGIYAIQVQGELPEEVLAVLEQKGITYHARDGSSSAL